MGVTAYQRLSAEAEWLVPACALTAGLAAFAIAESPDRSVIIPALELLPLWFLAAAIMAGVFGLWTTLQMMVKGLDRPFTRIAEHRGNIAFVTVAVLLAGLNMIAFMWVKPLLNHLVPFWGDPYLAAIDRSIFRTDPWRLARFLNGDFTAEFYHLGWFALMILLLLVVLSKPASPKKSATLLVYFLLWTIFGPVVHVLMPSAGPVFYQRLGYGDTFAALPQTEATRHAADYLWDTYIGPRFAPGSGISAMPSLHVATTAWVVLATYIFARLWIVPVAVLGFFIFALSISLGWHYAIDGLVGGAGTLLLYRITYGAFRAHSQTKLTEAPLPAEEQGSFRYRLRGFLRGQSGA
jgi:hypothetical protein